MEEAAGEFSEDKGGNGSMKTGIEYGQAKPKARFREKNNNWKGGRHVAPNGYVKVLMPDHHLADSKGYVYEHRIVAENLLGRKLLPGEIVHHIDGNKQNNSLSNIQVEPSRAHHRVEHRKKDSACRMPDEPNHIIECVCGCGASFPRYDPQGRPRNFVPGHNMILKHKGGHSNEYYGD